MANSAEGDGAQLSPFIEEPKKITDVVSNLAVSNVMLEYVAMHDMQTGLLNKEAWKAEVQEMIDEDEEILVAFFDLDAFKKVNDTLGHGEGDRLLEKFADFLQNNMLPRQEDEGRLILAHEKQFKDRDSNDSDARTGRLGGDEFGLIYLLKSDETDEYEEATQAFEEKRRDLPAKERADLLMKASLSRIEKFVNEVKESDPRLKKIGFNISSGYTVRTKGDPRSTSELMEKADSAMYEVKKARKEN